MTFFVETRQAGWAVVEQVWSDAWHAARYETHSVHDDEVTAYSVCDALNFPNLASNIQIRNGRFVVAHRIGDHWGRKADIRERRAGSGPLVRGVDLGDFASYPDLAQARRRAQACYGYAKIERI